MRQRLFVATIAVALTAIASHAASASGTPSTLQVVPSGAPTVFTSPIPSASATAMVR